MLDPTDRKVVRKMCGQLATDARQRFEDEKSKTLFLFAYAGHGKSEGGKAAGVLNVNDEVG